MPVIQFSVPADTYLTLLDHGRLLGLSEHQVAKYLLLASLEYKEEVNGMVMGARQEQTRKVADRKQRAQPIG